MSSERDCAEPADERGGQREHADLERNLRCGGQAENDEAADPSEIDVDGSLEQFGAMAAVVPKQVTNKNQSHVEASEGGGPSGADHAHCRGSPFAVDEHPIKKKIDEIRGDEGEGHWPDHVHGLDAAADGEIKHQREQADGQRFHVRNREARHHGIDVEGLQERAEEPDGNHEERRHDQAEVNAVDQGTVAIFAFACAEGLGDERVQANQQPATEKGYDVENAGADADGADRIGAVWQVADHDGVNDAHGHPADLGEDEREREVQGRAHFGAKCLQA